MSFPLFGDHHVSYAGSALTDRGTWQGIGCCGSRWSRPQPRCARVRALGNFRRGALERRISLLLAAAVGAAPSDDRRAGTPLPLLTSPLPRVAQSVLNQSHFSRLPSEALIAFLSSSRLPSSKAFAPLSPAPWPHASLFSRAYAAFCPFLQSSLLSRWHLRRCKPTPRTLRLAVSPLDM